VVNSRLLPRAHFKKPAEDQLRAGLSNSEIGQSSRCSTSAQGFGRKEEVHQQALPQWQPLPVGQGPACCQAFSNWRGGFSSPVVILDYSNCLSSSPSHFPMFADFYTVNWVCAAVNAVLRLIDSMTIRYPDLNLGILCHLQGSSNPAAWLLVEPRVALSL
jgi:hypothetical protein